MFELLPKRCKMQENSINETFDIRKTLLRIGTCETKGNN